MAAIDFPSPATSGQIFVAGNGVSYQYNGTLWLASGASVGGDFMATHSANFTVGTGAGKVTLDTVQTGNSGGWYSAGRYTPPAGRYCITASLSGNSSSNPLNLTVALYKNGVSYANSIDSAATNLWTNPTVEVIADSNGTDYWEMWASGNAGSSSTTQGRFSAYPISGIKGPPGDPPTAQSIMLYRSVGTAGVPTVSAQIAWDIVAYNTTGGTPSGGGFTVPANMGGVWDVQVLINGAHTSAQGNVGVDLYVNGVKTASSAAFCSTGGGAAIISGKFALAAGSVVTTEMYGSLNMVYYGTGGGGERYSWMHLTRVGA